MSILVNDFADSVREQAKRLGLTYSDGIVILPRNLFTVDNTDQLIHENSYHTLRSLFRQNGLPFSTLEPDGQRFLTAQENSFEWIAPILFISLAYLSANPDGIALALNILANYLTDFLRGVSGPNNIKLSIIVESRKGPAKKVSYEGSIEGLAEVSRVIKETSGL